MRQDGSGPARQHRSHPKTLAPQHLVTHRVHAAVKAMKATGPNALGNSGVPDAQPLQLIPADNAVLAPRERCQTPVHWG